MWLMTGCMLMARGGRYFWQALQSGDTSGRPQSGEIYRWIQLNTGATKALCHFKWLELELIDGLNHPKTTITSQNVLQRAWPVLTRAVSVALALGLVGGWAKGRFVLAKTALRNKRRLQRLSGPRPWQIFAPGANVVILLCHGCHAIIQIYMYTTKCNAAHT